MTANNERVAVVTGAASGLGAAIATALALEGFRIALVDRSGAVHTKADELSAGGREVKAFQQDLLDVEALPAFAAIVLKEMGRCDVLVNNAGCHFKTSDGHRYEFGAVRFSDWDMSVRLHMTVPLLLGQGLLPDMVSRRWGRVINIASRAGRTYLPNASVSYSATKAGLISLTRSIAGEYAAYGITANAIAPGRFKTPLTEICAADVKESIVRELRVGREGDPSEIGDLIGYLASDKSGFITGAVFDINGGSFMAP